jgi:hypothetical protein
MKKKMGGAVLQIVKLLMATWLDSIRNLASSFGPQHPLPPSPCHKEHLET